MPLHIPLADHRPPHPLHAQHPTRDAIVTPPDLAPALHLERPLARTPFGDAWAAHGPDAGRVMVVTLAPELLALVPAAAAVAAALRARVTTTAAMAADDALLPLLPLLPLLDVVDAPDGGLALVLPLEERAPAAVRLERGRAFATADVADAARALGSALQQAHAAGTRHGALCPAVLYLGDGRPARVVGHGWLDAFVEAGADRGAVLATLGARGFAAPELLRTAGAHEPVPPLADVYALGATLYACMTGKPPFGGRTTALMMATVLADEGLSGEMPQLPRGDAAAQAEHAAATERLTQALLRAVERAPEDRWPTAGEFVRALDPRVPTPQPVLAQQQVPAMQARGCLASVLVLLTLAGIAGIAGIAATASALLAGYRV